MSARTLYIEEQKRIILEKYPNMDEEDVYDLANVRWRKSQSLLTTVSRSMTPFNKFIQEELFRIKSENPEMNHRQAYKLANDSWQTYQQAH